MAYRHRRISFIKYMMALLLFGMNGIVASTLSMSSYEIVFMRTMIGSCLLVALYVLSSNKAKIFQNKRHLFHLAISGVAMGISWMFLYEAYQQVGVSMASLAYYCGPVIVMALSPLLFGEKLTVTKIVGFMAVLCGILLLNIQAIHNGKTVWGLFCGLMSAIMYALMVIFNKKSQSITGMANSMLQLTISFMTVAVYLMLRQGLSIHISHDDWIPILLLGLVNTGIGCYLYFSAIGHLPIQTVAIFGYLEPLSAVGFSVLLLREILQPGQLLGAALVIGGAIHAEGVFKRRNT